MKNKKAYKTYFILASEVNAVKIGKAIYPKERLEELQTGNPTGTPYRILGEINKDIESHLHKTFKLYKIRGKWFRFEGVLKQYIEERLGIIRYAKG